MQYSVRTKSPLLIAFPIATIFAAYIMPLENWVQSALLGILGGVIGGFMSKPYVERSFEPANASLTQKRRVVGGFALLRLVFGLFVILLSAMLFGDVLGPAFTALGGYLVGSTAAAPLKASELSAR